MTCQLIDLGGSDKIVNLSINALKRIEDRDLSLDSDNEDTIMDSTLVDHLSGGILLGVNAVTNLNGFLWQFMTIDILLGDNNTKYFQVKRILWLISLISTKKDDIPQRFWDVIKDDLMQIPSQTAFMRGRNILEGVVILHETIHELHRKKPNGKAYDNSFISRGSIVGVVPHLIIQYFLWIMISINSLPISLQQMIHIFGQA
ncbi:hypothetical protein ACJX0J_027153 [Zea mays]